MNNPQQTETLSPELIRSFVLASHGNLEAVQTMLAEHPDLLTVQYDWGAAGLENGLEAASHVGNRAIAELFLAHGVPLNIFTAAMLGQYDAVKMFIEGDPTLVNKRGVHGITLMFHASMSGDTQLTQFLEEAGCREGYDAALHGAIAPGHLSMVAWLLDGRAKDVNILDFKQRTPLKHALETEQQPIADLLRQHGAKETLDSAPPSE